MSISKTMTFRQTDGWQPHLERGAGGECQLTLDPVRALVASQCPQDPLFPRHHILQQHLKTTHAAPRHVRVEPHAGRVVGVWGEAGMTD